MERWDGRPVCSLVYVCVFVCILAVDSYIVGDVVFVMVLNEGSAMAGRTPRSVMMS